MKSAQWLTLISQRWQTYKILQVNVWLEMLIMVKVNKPLEQEFIENTKKAALVLV